MKILYIMHVEWGWIKQRPHFIAECLSEFFEINTFYEVGPYVRHSVTLTKNKTKLNVSPFYPLPIRENPIIRPLNLFYLKLFFMLLIFRHHPDYIWMSFPTLYRYIPSNHQSKLIYDCMDDVSSFDVNEEFKSQIIESEKRLIRDASLIFVSSKKLESKIKKNKFAKNKVFLIRNAYDGHLLDVDKNVLKSSNKIQIGYVGTISSWFDFDIIRYTLEKFKNIEYHLIGPIEPTINLEKYQHERITFHGPIDHEDLYHKVKDIDILIMPFKLSELVESVDPVKLYEYVNYNKPIISIFYAEIERFDKFVYFYSNKKELVNLIKNLIENDCEKKYSNRDRKSFLENNTWEKRTLEIMKIYKNQKCTKTRRSC